MISVKSNINEFLKNYRKKAENFKSTVNGIAEKIAMRMSDDMAHIITSLRYVWVEDGNLDEVSNIDFNITNIGDNQVRVTIGDNLQKFEMKDGTLVNPMYFIEFGFGIVGEENPKQNHEKYDWEYNIHSHEQEWYYYGKYGELLRSKGREGVNFLYNTIQDYRANWDKYLKELIAENSNV